ncbi:MAG: hypothetical protein V8T17_08740 [Oscillospiraceae bacterium]
MNSEDCTCIRNFCKEIGIPEKTAVALSYWITAICTAVRAAGDDLLQTNLQGAILLSGIATAEAEN